MALDARDRHDYERFHDLAWRTVQTGPPGDPALMYLLARAQALSGRTDDAVVMLGRLAEMGVPTNAAAGPEFERVRADPRWPRLQRTFLMLAASAPTSVPRPPAPSWARSSVVVPAPAPAVAAHPAPFEPAHVSTEEAMPLPPTTFRPAALAYDRVSARFVFADPEDRRLVIVDEESRHVVDLVDADSAGFHDITAMEIDPRRGDLWVVSADGAAPDHEESVLHKLQLVSGRPLQILPLPGSFGAARFVDVAISRGGLVFVLDAAGRRIFRLAAGSKRFEVVAHLSLDAPVSIAPSGEQTLYVAYASGIARVELGRADVRPLSAPRGMPLGGFERIRWDRDAIAGVQRLPDGRRRVVSLALNPAGRAVTHVAVADPESDLPAPRAAALSGHTFYYVAEERASDGELRAVVRRVELP